MKKLFTLMILGPNLGTIVEFTPIKDQFRLFQGINV